MKILFIGDIVGRVGRDLVRRHTRPLAASLGADLVIANGENAAGGAGITRDNAREIFGAGVDVITTGNHVWDKRETLEFIAQEPQLLRPANFPPGTPGHGSCVVRAGGGEMVGVINAMGRVFLTPLDDPFRAVERELDLVRAAGARVVFVDLHAEVTSEKMAMGWFLDGRVTALVGTHTHVQTADERVLPNGTAYLTDAGMTGPHDGVIGMQRDAVIARFTSGLPNRFEPATGDPRLHGVLVTADPQTGRATAISRVSLSDTELQAIGERAATVSAP